jgi:sec-independent protein translocase protein TatA
MFENIGGGELLLILFVVFIFFGPKQLPTLGKNLGKAVKEFKSAMRGLQDDIEQTTKQAPGDRNHR